MGESSPQAVVVPPERLAHGTTQIHDKQPPVQATPGSLVASALLPLPTLAARLIHSRGTFPAEAESAASGHDGHDKSLTQRRLETAWQGMSVGDETTAAAIATTITVAFFVVGRRFAGTVSLESKATADYLWSKIAPFVAIPATGTFGSVSQGRFNQFVEDAFNLDVAAAKHSFDHWLSMWVAPATARAAPLLRSVRNVFGKASPTVRNPNDIEATFRHVDEPAGGPVASTGGRDVVPAASAAATKAISPLPTAGGAQDVAAAARLDNLANALGRVMRTYFALPAAGQATFAFAENALFPAENALTTTASAASPAVQPRFLATSTGNASGGNTAPATEHKPWDPIARLPADQQARLSEIDRARFTKVVRDLQKKVEERGLPYVPVFGYLSLISDNYRELGLNAQSEVVDGKHVKDATLHDYSVGEVASTVFRGTPTHVGTVATLLERRDEQVSGVMLMLPLDRAEELLAVVCARELIAESDLKNRVDSNGSPISNAMYEPDIKEVVIGDGTRTWTEPALLFRSNEAGAKFLGDLTPGQRAYFMSSRDGGFLKPNNEKPGEPDKKLGGRAVDYWRNYMNVRAAADRPIDPRITAAVELAPLFPTLSVLRDLSASRDPNDVRVLRSLRVLFDGAFSPLAPKLEQADGPAVKRPVPEEATVDLGAVQRRAQELMKQRRKDSR